jgi:O-antigen ligase
LLPRLAREFPLDHILASRTLIIKPASSIKAGSAELFFCFIVLASAMATLGGVDIAGYKISGWLWLIISLVSSCVLLFARQRHSSLIFMTWFPFLAFVLLRTDLFDRNEVQRFFILLTPILVALAGSSLTVKRIDIVKKSLYLLLIALATLSLTVYLHQQSMLLQQELFVPQGMCMTLVLIAVAGSVDYSRGRLYGLVAVIACWVLCLLTESRNPVLTIPIILLIFILTSRQVRIHTKLLIIVTLCLGFFFLFRTEMVQRNIFRAGHGSIADLLDLDSSKLMVGGRLNAWPRFFEAIPDLWFGGGGVASTRFAATAFQRGWSHPHNEYLRGLFDYGIIGSLLLFGPYLWLLFKCYFFSKKASGDVQWLLQVSVGGIIAFFLLGITGNVLMYVVWFGNLLFCIIGVALSAYNYAPSGNAITDTPFRKRRIRVKW